MAALHPYPKYKPSAIDWLGNIPSRWSTAPLRRVASVTASNVDKHIIDGEIPVSLCNYTDVYRKSMLEHMLSLCKQHLPCSRACPKRSQIES